MKNKYFYIEKNYFIIIHELKREQQDKKEKRCTSFACMQTQVESEKERKKKNKKARKQKEEKKGKKKSKKTEKEKMH